MIIADPFGSWVQGAHEGQQDAIAMRNAQDEAARSAYGLQHASIFDPLAYRMAQNQATTSDLELGQNRKIYGENLPYKGAVAGVNRAELGNAQTSAGMGDIYPYIQHQIQEGGQFTPEGIQYNVTDYHGNPTHVQTPFVDINAANRFHYGLQQEYQQARIEAQMRGQDLTMDRFLEGRGMGGTSAVTPAPNRGYVQIPTQVPKATVITPTTPATQFTSAGTPQKGINLNNPPDMQQQQQQLPKYNAYNLK